MIEGDRLRGVEVNSDWKASSGHGVELSVDLDSGHRLFVVRTGVGSTEAEVEAWHGRLGRAVAATKEITRWPLGTGGEQVTLQVELADGFSFEADLILSPDGGPSGGAGPAMEDLEDEWVFEGTPGEEMGPH